jgi:hypothetical protein
MLLDSPFFFPPPPPASPLPPSPCAKSSPGCSRMSHWSQIPTLRDDPCVTYSPPIKAVFIIRNNLERRRSI